MILKKGSKNPNLEFLVMLRMIAIENVFRMSLMYMKKNYKALKEGMVENRDKLDSKVVKKHRKMMDTILRGMYPKERYALNNFEQLEKWLGHDLLVNTLAADGKTGGGATVRFRVFEKNIDKKKWKTFEETELAEGRSKPDLNAQYNETQPERKPTTTMQAKSRTKRHNIRGEQYSRKGK